MPDDPATLARKARDASRKLQQLPSRERAALLRAVANALERRESEIQAANDEDLRRAESSDDVEEALLQRLKLKPGKVKQLADGARAIANMEEPIGKPLSAMELAKGLTLTKVTAPLGVLLIIFESRPDALPQIASLALLQTEEVVDEEVKRRKRMICWAVIGILFLLGVIGGVVAIVLLT